MNSEFLKMWFILTMPAVVFAIADFLMMRMTGRDKFPKTGDPVSDPLNRRYKGYSLKAATDYWDWLRRNGALGAEQRFLRADLIFPFVYGGAMITSLLLAWTWLGHPLNGWWATPVAIAVLADWTENSVHLHQLSRFIASRMPQGNWIQVASIATIIKWVFVAISSVLIIILGIGLLL